jgi:DMSO/TMAO reductase YedYZ heme-binding membrane subunit
MGLLWGTIGVLILIVWAITVYDIFRRHLGGKQTALWLLLVIILPFVGALIYWGTRKETPEDVEAYVAADAALREENRSQSVDSTRTRL